MMNAVNENGALSENKYFSCLPDKLRCHLLPFQREGVAFGIQRNGRYDWSNRSITSEMRMLSADLICECDGYCESHRHLGYNH